MKKLLTFAFALSIPFFHAAFANGNDAGKVFNADTRESLAVDSQTIRNEMRQGGRYAFVQTKERGQVDAALTEMGALFDRYGSIDAMNQDAKIKLFNNQELVNAILTQRDERTVCKYEAPLGSHIRVTTCHPMSA
jgi:hypothetical protein